MLAHVEGGRVTKVVGDPEHPVTRGFICRKCQGYENWIHHPARLQYPLARKRKGAELERVSWDVALDRIAQRFSELEARYGGQAILPYSYLGHMGIVASRFPDRLWNRLGTARVGAEICAMAGAEATLRLLGKVRGTEPQHLDKTALYVAWGKNPKETNVHLWSMVKDIKTKVVIDPFASETALDADLHIRPKPGTDSFLALGIMKLLLDQEAVDYAFIQRHTTGFDTLASQALALPLSEVERITGVPISQLEAFTTLYREQRPGLIHIGVGLQRNSNGGEMVSAITMLAALAGQLGTPGGGVLYANYDWQLNDISYSWLRAGPPEFHNMIKLGECLTRDDGIKALFVYNQNPAVTSPNQNLVRQGLSREDLFVVVHDLFLTDTASFADVVLPATSFAESLDLQLSYWHDWVQVNNPAIPPQGESRSNHWVISALANRLGFDEPCFAQSEEEVIREALQGTGLDFDALREGPVHWNDASRTSFDDGCFPTPSGKIELTSLPGSLLDEETHRYRFITPKSFRLQGSQYGNMPDKLGELVDPAVFVHPEDAVREGIADGQLVRVWNGRGEVQLRARHSERTQPGLLVSYMVLWGPNANATTPDTPADMGGNSTFHSNYVSIFPRSSNAP